MKENYQANLLILLSTLFFLNHTIVLSQSSEKNLYRNLVKETLNGYYLDDNEKSFSAYTDYENLNLDLDYNIDLTMSEIREINAPQVFIEKSKEMAYTLISEISKSVLLGQISKESEYQKIILNFNYKTKDYQYVKYKFSINVQSLYELSENMNRTSFNRILKNI
jgi:hypothetical protein